ncbi:Zinc finger protein 638 [Oryzias melastigma]|uniref:Zinc finger protein 638 n=1 Tax=Oryzias melastigma TaxID=30732 RepID=A0A834KYC9_ORYME|nr:Zinc finger protein 638 [Oryzias melastigma]
MPSENYKARRHKSSVSRSSGSPQKQLSPSCKASDSIRTTLEELLLYPEEQMSPAMLAQILWKIRAEKDQRAQSEANPESSGSPSGAAFKSCDDEDFTGRRSGLNDKGSSVKAQCSSVKTPKPLQKSKQLRSSKTSVEKPKLKAKQSLKSKVCKSAPLKKKKTADRKTVQTDGKNKIKSSVKRIAAAKPAKTTKKLNQKDQEKSSSVSGLTKPTVVHAGPSHSSRQFPNEVPRSLPTLAMIQDYAAETPRVFPHSCCLCGKNSEDMMDWFFHQTSSLHLLNCKQLRTRFPEWDGEVRSILREPSHSRQPRASTRSQDKRRCRRRSWDGRSRSPSWSPPHPRVSSSSRSRSPHAHRGGKAQPDRRGRRSPGPPPLP